MYFEANLHMRVSFLGVNCALPGGSNFKLKLVRKTTTYWGSLGTANSECNVPCMKPAKTLGLLNISEIYNKLSYLGK
jgi:hypothetical protein